MNSFLDNMLFGNPVKHWMISLGTILLCVLIAKVFQLVVIKRMQQLSLKTSSALDDFIVSVIRNSGMPVAYAFSIYFGIQYLSLSGPVQQVLQLAVTVTTLFFVIRAVNSLIRYFFFAYMGKNTPEANSGKQLKGILLIIQSAVWVAGIIFFIDNNGYDVTAIVAGLGIGGIAIALASQAILGDLFSYFVIFFDKPFEVGDFIMVDKKIGNVENVGIKTTRIRAISGEQLVFSNTDLTNSRVHNFKRMGERRAVFSIGVAYNTPSGKLKKIPGMIKEIIGSLEDVRFDRTHFFSFGDFSLDFEIVYYVLSPDYNLYMDRQQTINLKIFEMFEQQTIEFAFPTQTLYLRQGVSQN